jgi:cardiolipin synthase
VSAVTIAFPITRLKLRLHVNKGQAWSIAEHLILEALSRRDHSLVELTDGFQLHQALVEEALMRLMRVEWVQPVVKKGAAHFHATSLGRAAVGREDLPRASREVQRDRWQLFERVTGHVFRVADLNHIRRRDLSSQPGAKDIRMMAALLDEGQFSAQELADIALEEDEELLRVEPTGEFVGDRVALVDVVDEIIQGLPAERELPALRAAILEEARSAPARPRKSIAAFPSPRVGDGSAEHSIRFEPDDLLVGGEAHRKKMHEVLESACTRIIIHSTFLSERRFLEWLDPMIGAMKRNVRIDILWGQEGKEDKDGEYQAPPAEDAVRALLLHPEIVAWQERITLHPSSTRSHAKVIVADVEAPDRWQATIGSCNWLDTPFEKVEASVCLSAAGVVRDLLRCLMDLVCDGGMWSQLGTDLYHMADELRRQAPPARPNGNARLVKNDDHNRQLLRARDDVRRKLLLVSHRLGARYDSGALIPLAAVCRSKQIDTTLLYSRKDDSQSRSVSQLEREARAKGITLGLVRNPKLHAKLLAWDDDSIVVTSNNWMSRDPGFSNLVSELGVAIEAPGVARAAMKLLGK